MIFAYISSLLGIPDVLELRDLDADADSEEQRCKVVNCLILWYQHFNKTFSLRPVGIPSQRKDRLSKSPSNGDVSKGTSSGSGSVIYRPGMKMPVVRASSKSDITKVSQSNTIVDRDIFVIAVYNQFDINISCNIIDIIIIVFIFINFQMDNLSHIHSLSCRDNAFLLKKYPMNRLG